MSSGCLGSYGIPGELDPFGIATSVLCVGMVAMDHVQICGSFPVEGYEQSLLDHRVQRGGSASNISTVLANMSVVTDFMGTMTNRDHMQYLLYDMQQNDICSRLCVMHSEAECPASFIMTNLMNKSLTVMIDNPNLPELTLNNFCKVYLPNYQWIHFEGRNVAQVVHMMRKIVYYNLAEAQWGHKIKISVDINKPTDDMLQLIQFADVVFIGREYAMYKNYCSMEQALLKITPHCKDNAVVICTTGYMEAVGCDANKVMVRSQAYPPPIYIDLHGAHDAFIAAAIYSLIIRKSLQDVLTSACKVAGYKMGIEGFGEIGHAMGIM